MLNSMISLLPASRVEQHRLFVPNSPLQVLPAREMYDLLEAYYTCNGLYDGFTAAMKRAGLWTESFKELRNPANRVVEFYAAKLWPGDLPRALPISSKNLRLVDPIGRIWIWSNWATEKQLAARWFAMMGDLFIKVSERDASYAEPADKSLILELPGPPPPEPNQALTGNQRKVFLQVIDPRHVTDFTVDERGFLTYARIDVPQTERTEKNEKTTIRSFVHTEIWQKNRVRIWQHEKSAETPPERLGKTILDQTNELGFIPIAYAPFRKISRDRGMGAFTHALGKIDECNRMATRLHQLLFRHNNVVWALEANATDSAGRPLPPPEIGPPGRETTPENAGMVTIGGETMIGLPGNSKLNPIIPRLDYGSMLNVLNAAIDELRDDLPELRYFETQLKRGVSGVAMRYMLSDASDRVIEARGNAEACLVRAQQMALTIAQRAQIDGFLPGQIGTYDNGDFDHSFKPRDIFPVSPTERAQAVQQLVSAQLPVEWVLKQVGFTEADLDDLKAIRDAETARQQDLQKQQAQMQLEQQAQAAKQQLDQQQQAQASQAELAKQQAEHGAGIARANAEHAAGLDIQTHAAKTQISQAAAGAAQAAQNGPGAPTGA